VLEGGLDLYLTPLTTLTVMVTGQQDRFESSPERDSDTLRVMPTIRLESPAIIQGMFGIGYRRFDGRDPALPDYNGLVYQGSLSHVIADRTKVDVGLTRDVQYSFEVAEPYYITTGARLNVTYQLRDNIDIRSMASRDRLDYHAQTGAAVQENRRDRVDLVSAGAGYHARPNLRIGVDVEYTRRLSPLAEREYDRTRVLGSVSYGY
jgi:hypothetical protein